MCNFIGEDKKVVYKRYASLYFIACVDKTDNELIVLEQIHLFVEGVGSIATSETCVSWTSYSIFTENILYSGRALHRGRRIQETSSARSLTRVCANMDEQMDEKKTRVFNAFELQ